MSVAQLVARFPQLLQNVKIRCRLQKSSPLDSIMRQMNPILFLYYQFWYYPPVFALVSKVLLVLHVFRIMFFLWIYHLSHACYTPLPSHLDLIALITGLSGEGYKVWSSSLCIISIPLLLSLSLLCPNILLSTLFSVTLNFCFSFRATDHVCHPHKTTGKIIVFCALVYRELQYLEDVKIEYFELNGSKHSLHLICSWILFRCVFLRKLFWPSIWKKNTDWGCSSIYVFPSNVIKYHGLQFVLTCFGPLGHLQRQRGCYWTFYNSMYISVLCRYKVVYRLKTKIYFKID
jgi:hypothetical protein